MSNCTLNFSEMFRYNKMQNITRFPLTIPGSLNPVPSGHAVWRTTSCNMHEGANVMALGQILRVLATSLSNFIINIVYE